jgi:spermidine synthase
MMASGFAGLGYQIVWTQQCALWLGHEAASVLAVVTAFFGGLGVGALLFGPRIDRSARPLRWYAGCELIIAAWGLVLVLTMPWVTACLQEMTGLHPTPAWQWTVAFFGTFLFLLPATAAMGATLPAMERALAYANIESRSIALLYASNTFGAVIGVLGVALWFIPQFGLIRATLVCIVLNLLCSALAITLLMPSTQVSVAATLDQRAARTALWRLAVTGLLGIGYEVLVVRVLSQVLEDTVYTFAILLAVYLVGSATGAAGYHRWLAKSRDPCKLVDQLLCALAGMCTLGAASLWAAEQVKDLMLHALGNSMTASMSAEAMLALLAFGPPTIVMGALFTHLAASARGLGVSFGRALGMNTLGAALAPLLWGVLAFPLLGAKMSVLLIGVGYLTLTEQRTWFTPLLLLPAGGALALALWTPALTFIDIPDGGHVISYQEGVMAAVSVVEDAHGVARLRINNRQQEGSNATLRVDARQGLLPTLLHPAPQRVLFLGLGTGVTASSAAQDPTLQVDAVELLPEVIAASAHFTEPFGDAVSARLTIVAADARRFVRVSNEQYDVIVSDNFHPARNGSGSLYTVEHFQAVRNRLTVDGVFCQWLPLHQLDLDTLRSIVQSFLVVYPDGFAMLASNSLDTPVIGLIGRADDGRFDVAALRERLVSAKLPENLAHIGIEDDFALLGGFVAGPKALRQFAGNFAVNTDNHPIVAYRAPHITYAPDSLPRERLIALLHELSIEPAELVGSAHEKNWDRRLAAYWQGRNRFIESGRNVRPSSDAREMLAQVREPLLSVLRISPDFRPAYDPLILMATSLAQTNVSAARTLLAELTRLQPERAEAGIALHQIGAP